MARFPFWGADRRATNPPSSGALVAATGAQNVAQLGAPVTHQTHLQRNHRTVMEISCDLRISMDTM